MDDKWSNSKNIRSSEREMPNGAKKTLQKCTWTNMQR